MFSLPAWIVLLPPCFVLASAILTRRLQPSIFLGLASGALFAKQFALISSAKLLTERLYEQVSDPDMLWVYIFLFCIGTLICLINYTGAATACALHIRKKIRSAQTAQYSCFLLSLLLGIDDYLNCLTVGYVMRPLTDSFGIAREKLAYLVHTFAGPLVILIPISTWATFITSQLDSAGIKATAQDGAKIIADPFYIYLQSIPFMLYPLFAILVALYIISRSISYGPMQKTEQHAALTATQDIEHHFQQDNNKPNAYISDLLIPLATLFITVFFGMLYAGDFWLFGGAHTLIEALRNNEQTFAVLGYASITTVLVAMTLAYLRHQLPTKAIPKLIKEGVLLMSSAVLLVITASTLGMLMRIDLQTGQYLASLLLNNINVFLLPIIFFVITLITSILIGTAWGTIALALPIAIPMIVTLFSTADQTIELMSILIPTIGAILAGSVFGDHNSPISAAGAMASTSAGCAPLDHIRTQLSYTLPALIGCIPAYILSGYLLPYCSKWLTLGVIYSAGLSITMISLYGFKKLFQ